MKATGRPGRKGAPPKGTPLQKAGANAQAEERLLVEAAQSDPARFDTLYELHFERVYGFIAGRVRDRAFAEDLTSEVFYKALANLKSYEWRGVPFVAWRSEEHTSELQSRRDLVCRLLLEKKKRRR